ncbi:MAG: AraD1 family protein [Tabrizicola sp.]|uniref:AraD1 family protein n=1 Tax=Tabrizicola sp. TaxID=2005166 RepID=UPI002733B7F3|nr:AraD1 family protein [Tabrizicola sp.]MDP3264292.1 GguC family protein [Tabrizicola sp.]MDP3648663.1 GguC family protein [Paracoccaceae bacterium]MDZ4088984.1 AraD1 family protein [Tabrizicola sp.]
MHLSTVKGAGVVARTGAEARRVQGTASVYELATAAIAAGHGLAEEVARRGLGEAVDLSRATFELPVSHPDPAHLHLTGTGLTHLGSASARDAMHAKLEGAETLTDSMKMFRMGLEAGRPARGEVGAQPEWFYKGNGHAAVAPGAALEAPACAEDGGEEPEVAGVYLIGPNGAPYRIGWALGNEFSDHVTERVNYLWLAHSKLRVASYGPEILVGELPADVRGTSRILRGGAVLWEKPFLSGEANMSHTLANLEHHHFKYGIFCQPGDLHVHFFGTATLSYADGIKTEPGDVFEIEADAFGQPLRNPLSFAPKTKGATSVLPL